MVDTRTLDLPHYELKNYVERFSGRMDELLNQKEALEELQESYVKQTVEIGHFVGLNLDLKKLAECKYIKFGLGVFQRSAMKSSQNMRITPMFCSFSAPATPPTIRAFISLLWNGHHFLRPLFRTSEGLKALESTPEKMLQELQEKISN